MALKLGSTGSALRVGSTTAKYARVGTTLKAVAPPLDIAGSAAAAYSLRKLSYAYTGPVVEVRRSSDNATADFTADEVDDGTLAAWVGAGNNGFVVTWYDQSGNSRDATQATAGSQPKVVSSGAVILKEGRPALEFDGTDDRMTSSQSHSQPATFFSVATLTGSGSRLLYDGSTTSARNTIDGAGLAYAGLFGLDGSGFVVNSQSLHAVTYNGASSTLHQNGALDAIGNPGSQGIVGLTVGSAWNSSAYWQGLIQELIIYPSDQSANRTAIEGNLCWYYGLENKLPYNHAEVKPQTLPTDTDVLAFAAASGAVSIPDLLKIEDLVAYLKAQSLWDYARFYPMKSAQNAGSGSTVYGLGGLTSNNMTLVNSPTWGSDGVTFDAASSQEGSIPDFLSNGDLAVFWRGSHTATTFAYARQFGSSGNRSFLMRHINRLYQTIRSANGAAFELYQTSAANSLLSDATRVMELYDLEPPTVFENNTEKTLAEIVANPQERFNSTADVHICSDEATFMTGTAVCAGFIENALTTTQRETITDLINAL